jgi:hypothetical protein
MRISLILATVLYTSTTTLAASLATGVHGEDVVDTSNQLVKRAQCPRRPVNVNCFRNPCEPNPCGQGLQCCADYSKGCDYICIRK